MYNESGCEPDSAKRRYGHAKNFQIQRSIKSGHSDAGNRRACRHDLVEPEPAPTRRPTTGAAYSTVGIQGDTPGFVGIQNRPFCRAIEHSPGGTDRDNVRCDKSGRRATGSSRCRSIQGKADSTVKVVRHIAVWSSTLTLANCHLTVPPRYLLLLKLELVLK